MNEMTLYWIWLQQCLGEGSKVDEIIAHFENPKDIYIANKTERWQSGVFTPKQLEKMNKNDLSCAENILLECEKIGCGIITLDSSKYPEKLKEIPDYPLVLYVLGDINCLKNKIAISMVGTRRASQAGLEISGKLASSLCRAGVVVVSGGAFGIDSATHLGAIYARGSTVAVLGCGFNAKYRNGISDIRQDIMEKGAIISEYHPQCEARGYNFPVRNRIISALSLGTVVIEAAAKSGSLITANLALEQGCDVFAVPGNAADLSQMGTVGLIRDGAIPVFSAIDILGMYSLSHPDYILWDKVETDLLYENHQEIDFSAVKYEVRRVYGGKNEKPSDKELSEALNDDAEVKEKKDLSENAKTVLEIFSDESVGIDEISEKTDLSMPKILVALTELEILGIIKNQPGKRYILS